MKTAAAILLLRRWSLKIIQVVIAGSLLVFASMTIWQRYSDRIPSSPGVNESYPHKVARFRAGADTGVLAACTNYTVGLKSIICLHCDTDDNNFLNWTATATVEYINAVGGIERTNYEFRPQIFNGAELDWFQK